MDGGIIGKRRAIFMLTKEQVRERLQSVSPRGRSRAVKRDMDLSEWFATTFPDVDLILAVYSFMNNRSPHCVVCGKPVKFTRKDTCSHACRIKMIAPRQGDIVANRRKTMLEKYGVENPGQSPEIGPNVMPP